MIRASASIVFLNSDPDLKVIDERDKMDNYEEYNEFTEFIPVDEKKQTAVVRIDGEQIHSMKDIHSLMAEKLNFPVWYGNNLDALYDCLTEIEDDVMIELAEQELLMIKLDSGWQPLLRVLTAAAVANPHLTLCLKASRQNSGLL